ncbi:Nascent polypeptide-associated complex subunit beta [Mortierella sp. AD094]|nr:Nascent polypeptide-associated complex subunit beta [Mortierella sp. AD094]
MNPEKLAKLQANANRSKGAPRRVVKKVHRPVAQDDRKLQAALEKLSLVAQPYVEEVNFFLEDGSVTHFRQPKVHISHQSNTYAIYGRAEEKDLTELLPGILSQLGPDSLANLRRLAQSYQQSAAGQAAMAAAGVQAGDDDDEVPDLVESFEDASIEEEEKKEEATA